ncbi:MAG: hypothetical protein AAGM67_18320, partial [Bacteroidota bacterium]
HQLLWSHLFGVDASYPDWSEKFGNIVPQGINVSETDEGLLFYSGLGDITFIPGLEISGG